MLVQPGRVYRIQLESEDKPFIVLIYRITDDAKNYPVTIEGVFEENDRLFNFACSYTEIANMEIIPEDELYQVLLDRYPEMLHAYLDKIHMLKFGLGRQPGRIGPPDNMHMFENDHGELYEFKDFCSIKRFSVFGAAAHVVNFPLRGTHVNKYK